MKTVMGALNAVRKGKPETTATLHELSFVLMTLIERRILRRTASGTYVRY